MREAIGGISIFQIVIVLILLFTGIMCLTINHSKAFGVKDEIITIIENNTIDVSANKGKPNFGISQKTINEITAHLDKAGYHINGNCPTDKEYVGYNWEGQIVKTGKNVRNVAFCIRANKVDEQFATDVEIACKSGDCEITSNEFPPMVYYDVVLFFQLDIPVMNYLFNFNLKGTTKVMFGSVR